ncbi:pyruvate kinase [Kosmotoga pacifica]|uniref:Pyruvate kinase n=1 Tax=Kosmotoga pacifica TaxID=1330330 RepID=A0A0G2ZCE1_9BACT|nr:pyruvate kinase [Kosmotoga pacifica]AKI97771.1 hypothetical protein IX53_08045 [Kosmotoga pacifica]
MKSFVIVATVSDKKQVEYLINGGADRLRINSSHLSIVQLLDFLDFFWSMKKRVSVYIDLKGNKLRLSRYQPELKLLAGQQIELTTDTSKSNSLIVDERILKYLSPDMTLSLSDGKIRLKILSVERDVVRALVLRGGTVEGAKGLNISPHPPELTGLTDIDRFIIEKTRGYEFVRYALSFVSSPQEVKELKELSGRFVVAKIERELSINTVMDIASAADELWLCRGDLGAQLGLGRLARFYRRFNQLMPKFSVPVLMAGGVLEHMIEHTAPTRSEVCHLIDLVGHGYSGVVLSDETVAGKYPIETLKIIREVTG